MPNSSPTRSEGAVKTPRRHKPRSSRSVGSPARSATGRLSNIVDKFKENYKDSFAVSPLNKTVTSDNTAIDMPRRRSWWRKVENSRDMINVPESDEPVNPANVFEEFGMVVLSQEKDLTVDLPESSGSESIHSIVIPQRKLFIQKENQPEKNFGIIASTAETTKPNLEDETLNVPTKNLFQQTTKRTKPVFPSALLNMTNDNTLANKTKEPVEIKTKAKGLFGNRPATKRKNMFADLVVSESEDEILELQPRRFTFNKPPEPTRRSSNASSITTDMELDDWKLLPSSTMVEHQLEAQLGTPGKRARLSKLSQAIESFNERKLDLVDDKVTVNKVDQENIEENKIDTQMTIPTQKDELDFEGKKSAVIDEQIFTEHDRDISKKNNLEALTTPKQRSRVSKLSITKETTQMDLEKEQSINIMNQEDQDEGKEQLQAQLPTPTKEVKLSKNTDIGNSTIIEAEFNLEDGKTKQNEYAMNVVDHNKSKEQNLANQLTPNNKARLSKVSEVTECTNTETELRSNVEEEKKQSEHVGNERRHDESMKTKDGQDLDNLKNVNQNKSINLMTKLSENKESTDTQDKEIDEQKQEKEQSKHAIVENDKTKENESKPSQNIETQQVDVDKLQNQSESKCVETEGKPQYENQDINAGENEQNIDDHQQDDQGMEDNQRNTSELEENDLNTEEEGESQEMIYEDDEQEEHPEMEVENDEQEIEKDDEEIEKNNEEEDKVDVEQKIEKSGEQEVEEDEEQGVEEDEEQEIEEDEEQEVEEDEEQEIEEDDEQEVEEDEEQEVEEDEEQVEEDNEEESQEIREENDETQIEEDDEQQVDNENEESKQDEEQEESQENVEDTDEQESNEMVYEENDCNDNQEVIEESEQNDSQEEIIEDSGDQDEGETQKNDITHDTTGRNRKKRETNTPEAILHDATNEIDSFTAKGRNTSVRKTIPKYFTLQQSMVTARDSIGLSDGTKNSSAEGSGWDSHRTTRKTLRQTFGKDFTPRKSLRALVMEKSAKRQTMINEANAELKRHQANSTELPEDEDDMEYDDHVESDHEVSRRMRQAKLEMYTQNFKKETMEMKQKIEEQMQNPIRFDILNRPNSLSIRRVNKPSNEPRAAKKRIKPSAISLENLPPELIEDMKYKPPKKFKPSNASWITKRLYKCLESKLEPKYDYKARVRAEKLVETMYNFTREIKRLRVAPPHSVTELKREMARLDVVRTHHQFYMFVREYLPYEVRIKVIPDIVNKIPVPKDVFGSIM